MDSKSNQIKNHPSLREIRKKLRTNGTAAEAVLWRALKNRQVGGWKWRRQFSVGGYILDFYCPKAKLGIELDGNQHLSSIGVYYDGVRTEYLYEHGIRILRFENNMIRYKSKMVLYAIEKALSESNDV